MKLTAATKKLAAKQLTGDDKAPAAQGRLNTRHRAPRPIILNRLNGGVAVTEFFIGVLSGTILNFLVTAWIVKQGADRTIAALDARQCARDAKREARAPSRGAGNAKIAPPPPPAPREPGPAGRASSSEAREPAPATIATPTGTMLGDPRMALKSALCSMGWRAGQVDRSIAWLGARVEREGLPALVRDANSRLAEGGMC